MENQEKPKTEFFDINDILKEEGIRKEPEVKVEEVDTDKLLETLTGEVKTDTPPIVIEAPKVDTPLSNYSNKLKGYIEEGFIEDVQITIGEGDEAEQKHLSELTDLDVDTYNTILSEYKKAKEDELKNKYISLDGLDERTKKYIELKKAGGDPSSLIQEEVQFVNPWEKLDLDDEQVQEHIVRTSLSAQGIKPKYIEQEIAELKENLQLDTEATKIFKNVQKQFEDKVEAVKKSQLEAIEADKKEQKEFRKTVSTELSTLIPNADIAKVILDNSTKRDENGLTNTDKLYFDAQKDPKYYAEISFFLNNKEEFYKTIGAKTKTKEINKTIKTLFSINPAVVKAVSKEKAAESPGDEVFKRLTEKYNQ